MGNAATVHHLYTGLLLCTLTLGCEPAVEPKVPCSPCAPVTATAAVDTPPAPASAPISYGEALTDAQTALPSEVVKDLVAIAPGQSDLVWKGEGESQRVLTVTWTSYKGYDSEVGKTLPLGRETWITPAPQLKNFCKGKATDPKALSARLEQLLGLPAGSGKDRVVELWVLPKDLFRPCPDPEITDHECGVDFPAPSTRVSVSAEHVTWFTDLKSKSYGAQGYPWTRLGYTYDWGGPKVGLSEFVIVKGAEIGVEKVYTTEEYCR
ncbi:MAG: hypothetical protein IPK82_18110 [Polyangiaceae bacterium]|nr:hypothetical protein [Polyangiaceae bacterium]